jgi:hypothetical protein
MLSIKLISPGCLLRALWVIACSVLLKTSAQDITTSLFQPDPEQLKRLTRTRSLLKSATADHHPVLRVMVYGQSHSLGEWSNYLAANLQRMYPHTSIVITNRAIAGFSALLLSRSVNADVVPWQPDLLLLHCMGDDLVDYRRLYSTIKSQVSCEVLVHADHIQSNSQLNESLDISEIGPDSYWVLRNYHWLPELVNKYDFCWADIRTPWKDYIFANGINYKKLLAEDGYHCNDLGHHLTADLISEFFRTEPDFVAMDPYDNSKIKTLELTGQTSLVGKESSFRIKGNRVDVVYDSTPEAQTPVCEFTVDGNAPEKIQNFYSFDRASPAWWTPWPGILAATHVSMPVEERWTINTDSISLNTGQVFFSVEGSITGKDGNGSNFGQPFVSNSKRLRIEPEAFMQHLAYALTLQVPPDNWKIQFDCVLRAAKSFKPHPPTQAGVESLETLFLSNDEAEHELKIISRSSANAGIKALRVYSPLGQASIEQLVPAIPLNLSVVYSEGCLKISWPISMGKGKLKSVPVMESDTSWVAVETDIAERGGVFECILPVDSSPEIQRFYKWLP